MRKLASCNRTVEEMKMRNDFMYYLVLNVDAGELKKPFTDDPPSELVSLAHLLVSYIISKSFSFITSNNFIDE